MSVSESYQAVSRWLDQRARALQTQITAAQGHGGIAVHEVGDFKDAASHEALDVVAGAEVERDVAELREINVARRRIMEGDYGQCADCGVRIDAQRLHAHPAASRCTTCQSLAEQGGSAHRVG